MPYVQYSTVSQCDNVDDRTLFIFCPPCYHRGNDFLQYSTVQYCNCNCCWPHPRNRSYDQTIFPPPAPNKTYSKSRRRWRKFASPSPKTKTRKRCWPFEQPSIYLLLYNSQLISGFFSRSHQSTEIMWTKLILRRVDSSWLPVTLCVSVVLEQR
jgi:hypothetical protein